MNITTLDLIQNLNNTNTNNNERTFIEIVLDCLDREENSDHNWLLQKILRNEPLLNIAKECVDRDIYYNPENGMTRTGLFYTYIHFKNDSDMNITIDHYYKISNNAGIFCQILKKNGESLDFISTRDIINHYDNTNEFWNWLENYNQNFI